LVALAIEQPGRRAGDARVLLGTLGAGSGSILPNPHRRQPVQRIPNGLGDRRATGNLCQGLLEPSRSTSAGSSRTSWCSTSRSAPVRSGLSAGGRRIRTLGSRKGQHFFETAAEPGETNRPGSQSGV
jgi:hypothetical protein